MSGTTSNSKAAALARVQGLIAGAQQHFPNGTFTLGNVEYTTASLVQELQDLPDAMTKRDAAETAATDARKAVDDATAQTAPLLRDFKRVVLAAFASTSQSLADFGLQAPKPRKPLSGEARAAATAKSRATRKARGTTSKKQKLAVKGDVTGVVVTPVTSAPAPASPVAQPASNGSSASAPTGGSATK
jgi:hypothetical protein